MKRVAALVAAVLMLAACTSIPTSGPVVNGQAVDSDPRDGALQVVPDGPRPGDPPDAVVRGFIGAAVGFSDDHSVARSFLHPDRRLAWNPDRTVAVYPQKALRITETISPRRVAAAGGIRPTAAPPATATVTVTAPRIGRVDETGRYEVVPPGKEDTVRQIFRLVRSDGEWRINELDDGLLMADDAFSRTFAAFPIYFSDPTGRFLVPDLHWLPGTPDDNATRTLPTVLVRSLLAGPADYLKGAVTSGAPDGTRMAAAAVVVSDQVATVDLTRQVQSVPASQRRLLLTQLRETLGQLRPIRGVDMTVDRSPVDVDGDGRAAVDPELEPTVPSDPVVLDERGRIARLDGRFVRPVKEMKGLAVPGATRPALSPDGSGYAVLDGARAHVIYQAVGGKPTRIVTGSRLTAPSFDPSGWVWTSSAWTTGVVAAGRAGQDPVKVKAPWLAPSRVISLRISRDGARALVAVEIDGQAHVFVSGVVRAPDGRPTALTQPTGLVPDLQTVTDAAWVDEDEVVVLGRRLRSTADQLTVAQIGGTLRTVGPVPRDARSVTSGNGDADIVVGTASGSSVRIGTTAWDEVSDGFWPAFAG